MRNKKAGLNLSINAIVVLILAITMLGLGLSFMRNIFTSATEEFKEVGGTVKKQMIDQMKETTKVVDLSNPKIKMKPGEKKQIFIGFKNEGSAPTKFQIRQVVASRLGVDSTNEFSIDSDDPYNIVLDTGEGVCGARTGQGQEPSTTETYLEFKNTPTNVEKGNVVVVPMNIISIASATQGTCIYELKIDTDSTTLTTPDYNKVIELTVDITT